MSNVTEVLEFLETEIITAVPSLKKSPFYYDFEKNPGTRNNYVFAVTPGSGSPISGVIRSATIKQDFILRIDTDIYSSEKNDEALRAAVEKIYADNEKILKQVSLRRGGVILLVEPPSFDAPEINKDGRSVSITFTYPIQYRNSVKGDS